MKKLILFLFLVACSTPDKPVNTDMQNSFAKAMQLTEKADYRKAIVEWEKFMKDFPTTELGPSAMYHKAYSHEQIGEYQSAINLYRSAMTVWGVKNGKDRAQALLRISACYEAMGDNAKSLASLQELSSNKATLSSTQKDIEIPARKALIYAKEGNQTEAKKYFATANKNMNQYLRKSHTDRSDWLAEILYRLSDVNPALSLPDFSAAMEGLSINQSYLAKVVEIESAAWSPKAVQRLKSQYTELKNFLVKYVSAKDVVERREQEEQQKLLAASFIDILDKLPQEFLPNSSVYEKQVEDFQEQTKKQVQDILLARTSGEGLTEDAQRRQGLKRDPQEPKLPTKLPVKKPTVKDPNL
jgi:tetratricopeptide (TPR) repeat protein